MGVGRKLAVEVQVGMVVVLAAGMGRATKSSRQVKSTLGGTTVGSPPSKQALALALWEDG